MEAAAPGGTIASAAEAVKSAAEAVKPEMTVGLDLGDRFSRYCLLNGDGEVVDQLPMQYTPARTAADRLTEFYALVADVWGDSREEVILFGSRGACIYANARLLPIPTLYNETLYPGM